VSNLEDDFYHFDEESITLRGERTGRVFRIGDAVRVRVSKVNVPERQIDFELVNAQG
jgi:ribonuclease R